MMSEGSSSNDTRGREGGRRLSVGQVEGLKKGPWTAAEDDILMEYVKVHGEGNWNAVQKNTCLMRCGKSCRLRWANHLRPNLKKGSFTPEEERIIIELHAKLGNKWARMASQLPGRTDNEIKNFWNTRIKRRQRAGLPIYTQENQEKVSNTHQFHFHQNFQDQQKHQNYNLAPNSPSYVPSLSLIDPLTANFSSPIDTFYPNNINHTNINGLGCTLSPLYVQPSLTKPEYGTDITWHGSNMLKLPSDTTMTVSRAPSCSNLINTQIIDTQSTPITPPSQTMNYNNLDDLESNSIISFTSLMMGATHVDPTYISSLNQLSPTRLMTPISSNASGSIASVAETSSKNMETGSENGALLMQGDINSGLLDALVPDSKIHSQKKESDDENLLQVAADKGKRPVNESIKNVELSKKVKLSPSNDNSSHRENTCSSQERMGTKPDEEEQVEEIHQIDDDLMSLLNNFPSSMPLPEWYQRRTLTSNNVSTTGQSTSISTAVEDHNDSKNTDQEDHKPSLASQITTTAADHSSPNIDRCVWNNMPGIC